MGTVDRHGLELSGMGPEAVRHYERALDALLFFRPEVSTEVEAALLADPNAPMANVFAAYLGLLGTESVDAAAANERYAAFVPTPTRVGAREVAHMRAAEAWLAGDIHRAGDILHELVVAYPRDALALLVGHQIDFLTGDALRLRDRVGGALSAWDRDDPHYGPVLGMAAFGLEETGHYARSEEAGSAAVAANPRDVWAIHAVVHTYEMQGRFAEGIRYLDARTADWTGGNYLNVHNWWHYGLFSIEAGAIDRALAIHDAVLHNDKSLGVAMELLDASALLWRIHLTGNAQVERWNRLADAWAARADVPYYAFNDTHAVMAYLGAGRIAAAQAVIEDRESRLGTPHREVANDRMTAQVGLPVCRALVAFEQGRYADTVDILVPIRHHLNTFGGSHAQRDAIQQTLVEAALRGNRHNLARTLLSERINLRPTSPYNWLGRARLADALGRSAEAAEARERAAEHRATITAAWGR
ncbi:tetratricopeptide repeat protein [Embleya sp. NPDC050154]|uniref:tetratricopeptide repeat protein n=1 Tax=Embleya sp. NPDC050154 TaxID=3363988 RepID=UPI0037BCD835